MIIFFLIQEELIFLSLGDFLDKNKTKKQKKKPKQNNNNKKKQNNRRQLGTSYLSRLPNNQK